MSIRIETQPKDEKYFLMLEKMKQLPQFSSLSEVAVDNFISSMKDDPRGMWHIARLAGIGGSEIGVVVAEKRGIRDAFGDTCRDLAMQKLLIVSPKKANFYMNRGILFEKVVRHMFHRQYDAVTDLPAKKLLATTQNVPRPWMRYSPDDVVQIKGKRYLVDYKTPTEATLHKDISLRYRSQLHLGMIISEYNDIQLDGMILVQSPQKGQDDIVATHIDFDESIARDMIEGGDALWNQIIIGELPPYPARDPAVNIEGEDKETLSVLNIEFVKTKALADVLTKKLDGIKEQMEEILSKRLIESKGSVTLEGATISVSEPKILSEALANAIGDEALSARIPEYDLDKMVDYLKANNVNLEQFETGEAKWNNAALIALADQQKIDYKNYAKNSYIFKIKVDDTYKDESQRISNEALAELPVYAKKESEKKKMSQ